MKIFLEGIDRIGKTTWAQRIVDQLGLAYFHPQRTQAPFDTFYERNRHNYLKAMELEDVVHDRTLISEFAYNTSRTMKMLLDFRPQKPALTFICVASEIFLDSYHQDFEKEVPGVPRMTRKTALGYAKKVNHRYFLAREHLVSRTNMSVYLIDDIIDRETAWKSIIQIIRNNA